MTITVNEAWIYFMLGMVTMFILIMVIGWLFKPTKDVIDPYQPDK